MSPDWYGVRYPRWRDLFRLALDLGCPVVENGTPLPAYLAPDAGGPLIVIPAGLDPLERHWSLAHELGHVIQHSGPRPLARGHQEAQANRWAACALIPEARIRHHQNASEDAMVAALSRHYEDLPLVDCPARRLAGRIARYRLEALCSRSPSHFS